MFQVKGDEGVLGDLHRAGLNMRNAKPAFKAAAQVIADAQSRQFNTEGGHYGPKWARLSPAYRASKSRTHPGKRLLERTGRLRREAAPRRAEGFGVYRVDDDSFEVGIDAQSVPYASRIHNGSPGQPARKLIGEPTKADQQSITDIIHRHIMKGTTHARR